MRALLDYLEGPALQVMADLLPAERTLVELELELLRGAEASGSIVDQLRRLVRLAPERLYRDSGELLLRMHEIAGSGTYQSCLSSSPLVHACFDLDLDGSHDDGRPALIVGRGHIAPAFYAESYVRGTFPFTPLVTLHRDGLPGVVQRKWGFRNTMRYSLGVGIAQAVSLAWRQSQYGDPRRVLCLAGDGELQEGLSFEGLRLAWELDLTTLIVAVDANGKGIEPFAKPLNRDYLAAFCATVQDVDGHDHEAIEEAIVELLEAPGPGALVCHTTKHEHSFKRSGAPRGKPSFARGAGEMLSGFARIRGRRVAVFTGDMAGRFGFAGQIPYTNCGLAETLSVGMTLSLDDEVVKVVGTDAKYYMDSLGMLTEATTSVERLLVLAGRSWGTWGGAINGCNLLGLLMNAAVYEPITRGEFFACLELLLQRPRIAHVLSMVDAPVEDLDSDCSDDPDGCVWVTPPAADASADLAVVTFGYATSAVVSVNQRLGVPHLHCAALRPRLDADTLDYLSSCPRCLAIEYNGVVGGFGEYLRSRYLIDFELHGVVSDIANCGHSLQLERHGMSRAQLRELLRSTYAGVVSAL
jgi:transketolase